MSDLYLGDILVGEVYETFDGREIYIKQINAHVCEVYERRRDSRESWSWNLRTYNYLRHNIRTIIEMI